LTALLSSLDPNTPLSQLLDEVTVGDLITGVEQLLSSLEGDANGFAPPAGMHPGGCPGDPNGRGAPDVLDLTDEQKSEANAIFAGAREDIDALHQAANDQIQALLTEEQLALLDEMEPNNPNDIGPRPRGHHGPPPCPFLGEVLNLTEEQKAAIQAILDDLRTAIQEREQQARDEFRAILTADQQVILDAMGPPGSDGGWRGGRHRPPAHP